MSTEANKKMKIKPVSKLKRFEISAIRNRKSKRG
jgi:hypothetical protein